MNQTNSTLAKRIADLERQLSNTKTTANTLLEENRQLLVEISSINNELQSSMLSEATAKQYAEEIDKQNQALAAQVEALKDWRQLALKFDGHRMQAMSMLKMVATGNFDMEEVRRFIAAAPVSGEQHLAEIRMETMRQFSEYVITKYNYDMSILCNEYADSIRRGEVK